MSIPKDEEDVKRIADEIMKEEAGNEAVAEEAHEHRHAAPNLDMISHELAHIQELLIHIIQSIRELRDSVDGLAAVVRKSLRTLSLIQFINTTNDNELRAKLLEQVLRDIGIETRK
ncbi:hypothetical protein QPL79_07360 [Ignisphaera sp. 4213-co]|uniref:Uncharacterized protein n=1 Tax=Ignisphaera cupida TaxID=3050454 RepID=A0ABD4Z9D4_9CREN|nr:hypothetical protein [Ignisphaera sp. 4213-co]MDK6029178.1 hypothetical protein [Ignisphaera sp. 4213-co]